MCGHLALEAFSVCLSMRVVGSRYQQCIADS
jgi:hypothetical protein